MRFMMDVGQVTLSSSSGLVQLPHEFVQHGRVHRDSLQSGRLHTITSETSTADADGERLSLLVGAGAFLQLSLYRSLSKGKKQISTAAPAAAVRREKIKLIILWTPDNLSIEMLQKSMNEQVFLHVNEEDTNTPHVVTLVWLQTLRWSVLLTHRGRSVTAPCMDQFVISDKTRGKTSLLL